MTVKSIATGTCLVRGDPLHSVLLVFVKRVDRRRENILWQSEQQYFLVSVLMKGEDDWHLAVQLADVLAWVWQRWELKFVDRELKSGLSLGEK